MFRSAQNVKSAFGIKFLKISEKNSILKNGTFYQRYRWWYLLYGPDKTGISLDETRRSKIEISWQNCSFFKKFIKRKNTVLCTEIAKHFEFLLYFWKQKRHTFKFFMSFLSWNFPFIRGLLFLYLLVSDFFSRKWTNFEKNGPCDSRQQKFSPIQNFSKSLKFHTLLE